MISPNKERQIMSGLYDDSTDGTLKHAARIIDDIFGDGYAKNNPTLVGHYLLASSINQIALIELYNNTIGD